jgi:hypothetical protein
MSGGYDFSNMENVSSFEQEDAMVAGENIKVNLNFWIS